MSSSKFKNVHTMIGPDAKVNGPIILEQGIIIYGHVDGNVSTRGSIRIARDGVVNGNVKSPGPKLVKQGSSLLNALASAGGEDNRTGYIDFMGRYALGVSIRISFFNCSH